MKFFQFGSWACADYLMKFFNCLLLVLLTVAVVLAGATQAESKNNFPADLPAPLFENPAQSQSDAGHIKLRWRLGESLSASKVQGVRFELQTAPDVSFHTAKNVYTGTDRATFISGLRDGRYYYRVRSLWGDRRSAWSAPVVVTVRHHSMNFAWTLFTLGLLVFAATVGVIAHGLAKTGEAI